VTCLIADGCVRAESAPQIHVPADQDPKVVLLDKAFVWSDESCG
jgi:hypothetical protein